MRYTIGDSHIELHAPVVQRCQYWNRKRSWLLPGIQTLCLSIKEILEKIISLKTGSPIAFEGETPGERSTAEMLIRVETRFLDTLRRQASGAGELEITGSSVIVEVSRTDRTHPRSSFRKGGPFDVSNSALKPCGFAYRRMWTRSTGRLNVGSSICPHINTGHNTRNTTFSLPIDSSVHRLDCQSLPWLYPPPSGSMPRHDSSARARGDVASGPRPHVAEREQVDGGVQLSRNGCVGRWCLAEISGTFDLSHIQSWNHCYLSAVMGVSPARWGPSSCRPRKHILGDPAHSPERLQRVKGREAARKGRIRIVPLRESVS